VLSIRRICQPLAYLPDADSFVLLFRGGFTVIKRDTKLRLLGRRSEHLELSAVGGT